MSVYINSSVTLMRCANGQRPLFRYKQFDTLRNPVDMTGWLLEYSLYDAGGADAFTIQGQYRAEDGTIEFEMEDGQIDALYGLSNIQFTLVDCLDNNWEPLASGQFLITQSPPRIYDYDNAPRARFVRIINHFYDPTVSDTPNYEVKTVPYDAPPVIPGNPELASGADFSNANASQLLTLF